MNPRLVPPARLARTVLKTQSDERLTALARAGSEPAFETLVTRHRRELVRHCARILGEGDAEEAVQEALVRAHAALLRGDPVHSVSSWLHVIAHNVALNLLRVRVSRARAIGVPSCQQAIAQDGAAERRVELNELVAALDSLPERQRHAIVMRELEGRSYAEIADRLRASPGAVRQLLNRARASVRKRLAVFLPWNLVLRSALSSGGSGAGSRLGVLPDACAATVKVCATLLPVATLGVGGATVVSGLEGGHGTPRRAPATAAITARSAPAATSLVRTQGLRVHMSLARATGPARPRAVRTVYVARHTTRRSKRVSTVGAVTSSGHGGAGYSAPMSGHGGSGYSAPRASASPPSGQQSPRSAGSTATQPPGTQPGVTWTQGSQPGRTPQPRQTMILPPAASSVTPVIHEDASDARNRTAAATASG
jgi:RNA polymerase sigma factor (sigma-70 family)